jgi:spermidine/putrescine ABC transporter ATP-binding subunit
MDGSGAAVAVAQVTKRYDGTTAVDGLSLSVEPGEFLALLGPSGCGKTTLLRLIAGFIAPDTGMIWIAGRPVASIPAYDRNLGMVFQSYGLFPHMTVVDNIAFGLKMRGVRRNEIAARVDRALELVRLPGFERRYPGQLSGGQQQRVALARAIVYEPDVLLLDEPLGALDKKLREEMQLELKTLQRTLGVTTIFVTHDQEEALTMADRIAVMNRGRIEQLGTPADVYERPASPFVSQFIGLTNVLLVRIERGASAPCLVTSHGLQFETRSLPAGPDAVEARIALRPEKIVLEPGASADHPDHVGIVSDVVYVGAQTHYYVALSGGDRLIVSRQNGPGGVDRREEGISVGSQVTLAWHPEDVVVLEESERITA